MHKYILLAVAMVMILVLSSLSPLSLKSHIALADSMMLTGAKDAWIDQNDTDKNHGEDNELKVKSKNNSDNRRLLVAFNFSSSTLPSNAVVTSATLNLFMKDAPSASRDYGAYRVLADWVEGNGGNNNDPLDEVRWNNKPATANSATNATSTGTTNNTYLSWDVTTDVAGFHSGSFSNFGWTISDQNENDTTSKEGKFRSREHNTDSERPKLEIQFTIPPAPTGSITIIKDTNPDDAQDFSFTTTGTDLSPFSLNDDADATLSNTKIFANLAAGSYTVTEESVAGWDLTDLVCGDPTSDSVVSTSTRVASIEVASSEAVTCTFTNTKRGHLIVQKTTNPEADPTVFIISASGTGTITDGEAGTVTDETDEDYEVTAGTYSVTETVPSGWVTTSNTCSNISVTAGQTQTCLITNTKLGSITINKITDPHDSGGEFSFVVAGEDFSSTQTIEGENDISFSELLPGSYTITENVPSSWDFTSATCGDEEQNSFQNGENYTVEPGEDVFCTFTNTKRSSITVTKIANPEEGPFVFTLSGPTNPDPETFSEGVFENNDEDSHVFENLLSGSYSLSESLPDGWDGITSSSCTSGDQDSFSPSSISLSAGQNISCIFNNTQFGSISGKKFHDQNANAADNNEPGLSGWTISLTGNEGVETTAETDDNGIYIFSNLLPDTYRVCEIAQNEWSQSYPTEGFACDGSQGYEFSLSAGTNAPGKNFGNYQKGSISGTKFADLNGNGEKNEGEPGLEGWIINLFDGTATTTTETDDNGFYEFANLIPGAYTVSEEQQDGWSRTMPENSASYSVNISGLNAIEKDFGNHQLLVISEETGTEVGQTSAVITWTTDFSGTSRVIYDIVSHSNASTTEAGPENYGYAFSTIEDISKTTGHTVTVSGLSAGTTYFYRVISSASPESVGDEQSFTTPAPPTTPSGGGGGGGGGGTILVIPTLTSTSTSTPVSQEQNLAFTSEPTPSSFNVGEETGTITQQEGAVLQAENKSQKEESTEPAKILQTAENEAENLIENEAPSQNLLLAAIGNLFNLGISNRWLIIFILVIIGLLAYFFYRRVGRSKKRRDNFRARGDRPRGHA